MGTAMCCSMAAAYASLFMDKFEMDFMKILRTCAVLSGISWSAFSTVRGFPNSVRRRFGSVCAYARVDLKFSLTVLPRCGRCCTSVLLCLRLIPELKCLHSNVYCAKCLFLCWRYENKKKKKKKKRGSLQILHLAYKNEGFEALCRDSIFLCYETLPFFVGYYQSK